MIKFSVADFDFTHPRVRYQGVAQSKFELSYLIGMIKPLSPYAIYPDAYLYADYVCELKSLLSNVS